MLKPNDHIADHVDAYLHDLLAPADASYLEQHCDSCATCKDALDAARKRHAALTAVPASEASEQLVQATLRKIDAHEQGRKRLRRLLLRGVLLATAASVLILGGFHLYYLNLTPTPHDLKVFGQSQLLAGTFGSLRIRLVDRKNGSPLAAVPVDIELRGDDAEQAVQLASFTTDDQGTGQPAFKWPDWPEGTYELRVTARPAGRTEIITEKVRLQRSWKLMLSSDKPVYQPGQTIHVRALGLRRPDLKPIAGQKATFTIADPKGNIIFKQRDTTSDYGITAVDCPLAGEILEGPYTIACTVGDTESKLTVEVKKYVLPKFKVEVTLDQPYYQPGQTVRGTVQADYFFGKPVADGDVEIEIRDGGLPLGERRQPDDVGKRLKVRTNGSGKASFEFVVPKTLVGREQDSGDARLSLQVTVSDTAGQKQAKSVSRVVTANPLRVEVIPEAGSLVQDVNNTIYLFASYADGRPAARARIMLFGYKYASIRMPEGVKPPGNIPEYEFVTNEMGVASFEITPNTLEAKWWVEVADGKGLTGQKFVRLTYGQANPDFLIRTDKAVYDSGDTLRLVALGGGQEPVFVDFIKDGQTVLTETVALKDGKGEYQLDIPPEWFGTLQLCAYRFSSASSLPVRKTRVLYVRQAGELCIRTTLNQEEYRPGGKARIEFTLTDQQGKAVPGALSLAAVDEAVFSVLDQMPGMEKSFYLLEQKLMQPVYALYAWSPDLTTSLSDQERNRFEQALFARAAQTLPGSEPAPPSGSRMNRRMVEAVREDSLHSLTASTFVVKAQQVEEDRKTGLHRVKILWIVLMITLVVAVYTTLWLVVKPDFLVKLHVVACSLVIVGIVFIVLANIIKQQPLSTTAGRLDSAGADRQTAEDGPIYLAVPQDKGGRHRSALTESVNTPPAVRVRELFPETLLWRPQLITDNQGRAHLDMDLADSITTWRLSASAVDANGRLGSTQAPVRVFQPFFVDLNLPVALTRGDEVAVPVVVYNYLKQPQTVELTLENADWFERLEGAAKRIELAAGEVRATSYRLRVTKIGEYQLQVTARGSDLADAIKRKIEVVPDGRRVEQVVNGTLPKPGEPMQITLNVPADVIDGSPKAILKIYPSDFSQLVEGLDNIFQMPYGCFEQTSSTTYPNVLALDYLRRSNKSVPAVEAKARQYIHLGYQRLLTFEVSGGGFDWFGRPPANRRLTAYGLMEFQDMAKVHDVDPKLIERTRAWLLKERNRDGSWSESDGLHPESDPARGQKGDLARLSTTAYIAWAVFSKDSSNAQRTQEYLLSHKPDTIKDPYVLALVCNALLAIDPRGRDAGPYLERLDALKQSADGQKLVWWEQAAGERTAFYGAGRSGSVETTALAVLALVGHKPGTARGALAWLVQQKDPSGTWHSTQATVLTLKALLTGKTLGGERERRIEIALGDKWKKEIVIPADQAEVMQQIDLSKHLGSGAHRLTLIEHSDTAAGYQVAFRYHVPGAGKQEKQEPLSIQLAYDRTDLAVGDMVKATATVENKMQQEAPMVILDLPIPAGFTLVTEDLARMVPDTIAKFQVTPRSAIVYLRGLEPGKPLQLRYNLRATMPVKTAVPPARVYEYYDPDKQGHSQTASMTVVQGR